jgi:SRSO17 transposase
LGGRDTMSQRQIARAAPGLLEQFAQEFDGLFSKVSQREAWRAYLEGLLLPSERNKTLTGLANTEPSVEAQAGRAQKVHWFLSESSWDAPAVNRRRIALLGEEASTAPSGAGVLVMDETGDRKDGSHTAPVGRQYLANVGKIDNGVVSVPSLGADERAGSSPWTLSRIGPPTGWTGAERTRRFELSPTLPWPGFKARWGLDWCFERSGPIASRASTRGSGVAYTGWGSGTCWP